MTRLFLLALAAGYLLTRIRHRRAASVPRSSSWAEWLWRRLMRRPYMVSFTSTGRQDWYHRGAAMRNLARSIAVPDDAVICDESDYLPPRIPYLTGPWRVITRRAGG